MADYINSASASLTIGSASICLTSLDFGFGDHAKIDTTTFCNANYKTFIGGLIEVPDITFSGNLQASDVAGLIAEKGVNQLMVITFVDTTTNTWSAWGFLSGLNVSASGVDELVTISGTITVSNVNGSSNEEGPVWA